MFTFVPFISQQQNKILLSKFIWGNLDPNIFNERENDNSSKENVFFQQQFRCSLFCRECNFVEKNIQVKKYFDKDFSLLLLFFARKIVYKKFFYRILLKFILSFSPQIFFVSSIIDLHMISGASNCDHSTKLQLPELKKILSYESLWFYTQTCKN